MLVIEFKAAGRRFFAMGEWIECMPVYAVRRWGYVLSPMSWPSLLKFNPDCEVVFEREMSAEEVLDHYGQRLPNPPEVSEPRILPPGRRR